MPFRVGYLDRPMHPAFDQTVRGNPSLTVERIAVNQPHDEIMAALKRCHGYYVSASQDEIAAPFYAKGPLIEQLPQLLLVCSFGAGYDTVDVDACTRAGIPVVNQAGGNAEGVAEHALGLMLVLLKRIPEAHAGLKAGMQGRKEAFMGRELIGRTVGIVGLGHVGSRIAQLVRFLNCRVLAHDPYLDAATCKARGAEKVELAQLLAESDVVSVHCPLTKDTRGLFDAKAFAAMRRGAIFVTTARGSIHDETALHEALVSGQIGGAGLDVWAKEPPRPEHPLLSHPAVLASPHTAGVTHESRERVARMAAEAFIDAAAGRVPPRVLNPEVLPRYKERWAAAFGTVNAK
ncbi:MAG TPA: hydroxyacid dehydrogenase [Burkholderiales bacterium]|nr:hydroxyacid dehydrogenase [Burkholderiales bacterium]